MWPEEKPAMAPAETISSSTSSVVISEVSSPSACGAPLLLVPSSSKSHSALTPTKSIDAFLVKTVTGVLWALFGLLDVALSISSLFCNSKKTTWRSQTLGNNVKTVAIVGGNFAGLAALRELQKWQKTYDREHNLRIVLIDKREYSEYTPGILRLFCDPGYFFHLAQALPETAGDGWSFKRIHGTVTSIVEEGPASGRKVLTYLPATSEASSSTALVSDINTPTPPRKNLSYDYLILATGATYNEPISPEVQKMGRPTMTMLGRFEEWKRAHERLKGSKRVLILGGGAVGVELAAEILDHNGDSDTERTRISVTIVDAQSTLVPLFPRRVGAYAEEWLLQKGAQLRLGESLRSWNERSCTLKDGTVLCADIVFVCFGNRPNSEMVWVPPNGKSNKGASESDCNRLFSLTRRRNVMVEDTLQLVVAGDDDAYSYVPWFACGDVASPPSNDEKQAFQAEMQGKLAARNVIKLHESSFRTETNHHKPRLLRYPMDITGGDRIPLVFVLSLGRYDGVLGFNGFAFPGSLAAIVKWILEYTKVSQMRGRLMGNLIWKIGDAATLFLSRTLFRTHDASIVTNTSSSSQDSAAISNISTSKILPPSHPAAPPSHHQLHQYRQLEEQLKLS